jgi:hypothetical protein
MYKLQAGSLLFLESEPEKMTGWKACPTYSQITVVDKNQNVRQIDGHYLPIAVIGTFIGNLLRMSRTGVPACQTTRVFQLAPPTRFAAE